MTRLAMLLIVLVCACQNNNVKHTLASSAEFRRLTFVPASKDRSQAAVERGMVTVDEPDDPAHPTAWQGPLGITESNCKAELAIISAVYLSPAAGYLIVVTYSGSIESVHFVDLKTCQERWPAVKSASGGVKVISHTVTFQPICERAMADVYECTAARVLDVDKDRGPTEAREESRTLTQEVLGVAFLGTRKVENPKTAQARVVNP